MTPFRILDTRSGFCGIHTCPAAGAGQTLSLQLTGYTDARTGESVPTDATAVVLNVLAVNGSSSSLLTVYPSGTGRPLASDLNFPAHVNIANLVTVALGQNGASDSQREVNIYNALGTVNVVVDVEGYFVPQASNNPVGEFHPIVPLRVCDTRTRDSRRTAATWGTASTTGSVRAGDRGECERYPERGERLAGEHPGRWQRGGSGAQPDRGGGHAGHLAERLPHPEQRHLSDQRTGLVDHQRVGGRCPGQPGDGAARPRPQRGPEHRCVRLQRGRDHQRAPGCERLVRIDDGQPGDGRAVSGDRTHPDLRHAERTGTPCSGHQLTSGGTLLVAVAGVGGIPGSGPVAIIANLTAVSGSQLTYLTVYPADVSPKPNASDLNVQPGIALPNLVVVGLATGAHPGDVNLFNAMGSINAVLDVDGWFQ